MENTFNIEEHTKFYTARFAEPQVPLEHLRNFIDIELKFGGHTSKDHVQQYGLLFHTLRDRLIIPNYSKFNILPIFEELANLMRRSGVVLPPSENAQKIISAFKNSYDTNEPYWKLNILRMDTVIKSFVNSADKTDFLKRMSMLKSGDCFANMEEIRLFAQNLRMLFPTCQDFVSNYMNIFNTDYFDRDITAFKAGIIWIIEISWNVTYKEDKAHILLMTPLIRLMHIAMDKKCDEAVFYLHFPISHIYLNLCHTQEEFKVFNEKVEMPFSCYVADNAERWGLKPLEEIPEAGRKKIGFVFDRLVGSSPVKLLISLLNYIKDEPFDLFVYDMAYIEKAPSSKEYIDEVTAVGAQYVNGHELIGGGIDKYYSHFEKCAALRNRIVQDGVDILIATGNRTQTTFLFGTRTAPKQIYWDHGNHEYDILGIDKRICHFDDGHKNDFTFERFTLPMMLKYLNADEEKKKAEAAEIKKKLPPHKVILGSIGRIMKLSDEYLETVADILKNNPDTIYLACGTGSIEEKRAKVRALGVEDRFIFTGWVDAHVYGHVIDIYLNTFPLTGGESVNEFLAKGDNKYVVSLS
jgi:glycosyltransferase involved in cell wall biosynthesis